MLDKNKIYGLSLEGGGFRGSYQAGAITALFEKNIKIGAVCGTSVGALNAAFVAMKNIEKLKNLWLNFNPSDVFDFQNQDFEQVIQENSRAIKMLELGKEIIKTTFNGGLNIEPLIKLIDKEVDEDLVRNSNIDMGLVAYNLTDRKPEELMIKDIQQGDLTKYLMASAYFPAFKLKRMDGKLYLDGGVYNNLPSNMLADRGYTDIIEIRLHKVMSKIKRTRQKVNLHTINYQEYLGPVIIYKKDKIVKNFENGYRETIEFIEKV